MKNNYNNFTTHDLVGKKIMVKGKRRRITGTLIRYFDQNGSVALKDYKVTKKIEDADGKWRYTTSTRGKYIIIKANAFFWIERPEGM